MILTEGAIHVAPGKTNRPNILSRIEVIERLLLYRVQVLRCDFSPGREFDAVQGGLPDFAKSYRTYLEGTTVRAELADYAAALFSPPLSCTSQAR